MSEKYHMLSNGSESNWPSDVIINTDGACRGNPGPSSVGLAVTKSDGETVFEYAETLGSQTNNFAEYKAVVKALQFAVNNSVANLTLRSDSQLLIRQLNGEYKVKSAGLRPLFMECQSLARQIDSVQFEHVRREFNKRADALANQVLDEAQF